MELELGFMKVKTKLQKSKRFDSVEDANKWFEELVKPFNK